MIIDYDELAKKHKPKEQVRILLIGEAPPPGGKRYFYLKPNNYRPKGKVEMDQSLPATIFNHYFGKRPADENEYSDFLIILQDRGIFLIDLINKPLRIREKYGLNYMNLELIFSDDNLGLLEERISGLTNQTTTLIFLLARNYHKIYRQKLTSRFPNAKFIRWKDFRLDIQHL